MRKFLFDIDFNPDGTLSKIANINDVHAMNWCRPDAKWGEVISDVYDGIWSDYENRMKHMTVKSVEIGDDSMRAEYTNTELDVTVERYFTEKGRLAERYTVKNISKFDLFIEQDNFGIRVPFDDRYTDAATCMTNRCNTHIWCGKNVANVCALKMGPSDINLGLVLTRGNIASYSTEGVMSNDRGKFILNSGHIELLSGEEYTIEWELFWHRGREDFYDVLGEYNSHIGIKAKHFTVFENENIEFDVTADCDDIRITVDGENVDAVKICGGVSVSCKPKRTGEHVFEINAGGAVTHADFFVSPELDAVVEDTLEFVVKHQQYIREGSHLDGAFLVYDCEENHVVNDENIPDRNACHERIGMALLLAKYLRTHPNEKYMAALEKYIEFVFREFYDTNTGRVYPGIGKCAERIRLYDAPWVADLFCEVYYLTGDKKYLYEIIKIFDFYYAHGGDHFYPNGFSPKKCVEALRDAGMDNEAKALFEKFKIHVDNMVKIGTNFPPHEVNYEQTIVSPAATFISEMKLLTGDDLYTKAAALHIELLDRFDGAQPDHHLHEIPVRYWDGFWFGKALQFGDTMPHYWSCLTARSFADFALASGNDAYLGKARECIRNCMSNYRKGGKNSCAYIYPYKVNGKRGKFYDPFSNDQNTALYFALQIRDEIGEI